MPRPRRSKPAAKQPSRYHHGNLPEAMLQEAVRTIQKQGVDALTLRGVGERLGVSRTALYRHFADKQALLAAVAAEGFRTLRTALADAWESGGRGREGFDAMGLAYVHFAVTHPSHYRVMFGGAVGAGDERSHGDAGTDAFRVLLDAIVEQQAPGPCPPRRATRAGALHLGHRARRGDAGAGRHAAARGAGGDADGAGQQSPGNGHRTVRSIRLSDWLRHDL